MSIKQWGGGPQRVSTLIEDVSRPLQLLLALTLGF